MFSLPSILICEDVNNDAQALCNFHLEIPADPF